MSLITPSRCWLADWSLFRKSIWRGASSVFFSRCAMPRIAFSGVRISWLMLERKSALVFALTSACSLAICIASLASRSVVMSSMIHTTPLDWSCRSIALPVRRAQKRLPSLRTSHTSNELACPCQICSYASSCVRNSLRSSYMTAVDWPSSDASVAPSICSRRLLQRTKCRSVTSAMPDVAVPRMASCSAFDVRSASVARRSAVTSVIITTAPLSWSCSSMIFAEMLAQNAWPSCRLRRKVLS